MRVLLLHRDADFAIKPELRDAIFRAMVENAANPFAIENARRNREREQAHDPDWAPPPRTTDDELAQDLELGTIWDAMSAGDDFLYEVARRGLLSSLHDREAIVYRQRVLGDCLQHEDVVRDLYTIALAGLAAERAAGTVWSSAGPWQILHRSVQVLQLQLDVLKELSRVAAERSDGFDSEGFTRFFAMIGDELSADYLAEVDRQLGELRFGRGVLETASLGKGLKGSGYVVREERGRTWTERLRGRRTSGFSFQLHPRDDAGFKALEDIRGRGINQVANAVAQSADHVMRFFAMLRLELAFYVGCVNLHHRLREAEEPVCFPEPLDAATTSLVASGLYDVSLALHLRDRVVANDVDADATSLMVITGANQGGKSTLLRGLGLAQLLMQAGMFVGAESFRANVCDGVFTHYRREEDATMTSGKLDEELSRMSSIAAELVPGSLLLCNESFASTNEREGAEISRQIVHALVEKGIKVCYVTHLYDLARGLYDEDRADALFLRAERRPDGTRTFRLPEGEPLSTSYGADSYRRIFGADVERTGAAR